MLRVVVGLAISIALITGQTVDFKKAHVVVKGGNGMCNGALIANDLVLTSRDCLVLLQQGEEPAWVQHVSSGQMRLVSANSATDSYVEGQGAPDVLPTSELALLYVVRAFDSSEFYTPDTYLATPDGGSTSTLWKANSCVGAVNQDQCDRVTPAEASKRFYSAAATVTTGQAAADLITEGVDALYRSRFSSDDWLDGNFICPTGCGNCGDWGAPIIQNDKLVGIGRGAYCSQLKKGEAGCFGAALSQVDPANIASAWCASRDNFIAITSDDITALQEKIAQQDTNGDNWASASPPTEDCLRPITVGTTRRHEIDSFAVCVQKPEDRPDGDDMDDMDDKDDMMMDKDDMDDNDDMSREKPSKPTPPNEVWVTLPKGFMLTADSAIDWNRFWGVSSKPSSTKFFNQHGKRAQVQLRWKDAMIPWLETNTNHQLYFEVENVRNPNNCDQQTAGKWELAMWNCENKDLLGSGKPGDSDGSADGIQIRRCPARPVMAPMKVKPGTTTYTQWCDMCNACYVWTPSDFTNGQGDTVSETLMKCEHDGVEFVRFSATPQANDPWFGGQKCYLDGVGPLV